MEPILRYIITFLSILLFLQKSSAFIDRPNQMDYYSIVNGLSHDEVSSIIKDADGFIWVGTRNGLNRFNSYSFSHYRTIGNPSKNLPSNDISYIYQDKKNTIWVATHSDIISRYSNETDDFVQYSLNKKNVKWVNVIYMDSDSILWLGTTTGLFKFDEVLQLFVEVDLGLATNDENIGIKSIIEDKYNNLWLATISNGLVKWSKSNSTSQQFFAYTSEKDLYRNHYMSALKIDRNENLWISHSSENGLSIFNLKTQTFIARYNRIENPSYLLANNCTCLETDDSGYMWIGTTWGIDKIHIDSLERSIRKSTRIHSINKLLTNANISTIYRDNTGIYWIGTKGGGLNVFNPNKIYFTTSMVEINETSNLLNKSVKSVYNDKSGNLWVGTDFGLNKFRLSQTGSASQGNLSQEYILEKTYRNKKEEVSISIGGVMAIHEESPERFWIGTWGGGLNEFNPKTEKFTHYPFIENIRKDSTKIGDPNILNITPDGMGNLWIGTTFGILDKFNIQTRTFRHFDLQTIIYETIYIEPYLYCATQQRGLIQFNTKNGELVSFLPKINSEGNVLKTIRTISKGENSTIWIGTDYGLFSFNTQNSTFSSHTRNPFLRNISIQKILVDQEQHLWLSSTTGLLNYRPDTEEAYWYDSKDGVKINAGYGTLFSDGKIALGGANGINLFHPRDVVRNLEYPKVIFTDFKLFYQSVTVGENSPLEKPVNYTNKIVIPYHKRLTFSMVFAALSFTRSDKNQYSCMLENFDEDWVYLGSTREVTYSNLNPGKYIFKVKASNNDGTWNPNPKSVEIIITPPFWKTTGFRALIIVLSILIYWFSIRIRTSRLKRQKEKLERVVKLRTQELEKQKEYIIVQNEKVVEMSSRVHEIDQKKIQFLVNLSHEFKTPITLITNPLNTAISKLKGNPIVNHQLSTAYKNAQRLERIINQIQDIRDIESSSVRVKVSKSNIVSFIKATYALFEDYAQQNGIDYKFIAPSSDISTYFDGDKVEKIVYNLLSNAFKFTQLHGHITVEITGVEHINNQALSLEDMDRLRRNGFTGKECISISVQDNGQGIPPESINKIFDRFYQAENTRKRPIQGTGIGLNMSHEFAIMHHGIISVSSTLGLGSIFKLVIPALKSQYQPDEIQTDSLVTFENKKVAVAGIDNEESTIANKNSPLILVADDDRDIRKFLEEHLESEYRTILASDGESALRKAGKHSPDLIISDIMMPGINGYELCMKVKSDEHTSHIPVILLTAKAEAESQIIGFELGADDYISKPFDVNILKARVRNILESRETLRKLFKQSSEIDIKQFTSTTYDERFIKKTIDIIEKHISEPGFDAVTLSREISMGRTSMYNKIRALTNLPVNEFIKTVRLKKAANLLRSNNLRVAEVAFDVGFVNISHFTRCFKEQFGTTPSEYQKSNKTE